MSRCKFCSRKLTPFRKRGRLEYHAIYARDQSIGYLVCVDCLDAIEKSIKVIHEKEATDLHARAKLDRNNIIEMLRYIGGILNTVGHFIYSEPTRIVYFILGGAILYGIITAWLSGGII